MNVKRLVASPDAIARLFPQLLLLAVVFLPLCKPANAVDVWAVTSGVPCCEIPDPLFKYLDADTACQVEVRLPADTQCNVRHRNMRNLGGPQNNGGGCAYDVDCVCGDCMLASGPHTTTGFSGKFPWKKARTCPPGTTLYFGRCETDPPKGKGACNDCDLALGNPANIASGNKYQAERIYDAASGGLHLVLFYNSYVGDPYFQIGAFGRQWSTRYTARVRNTFQGIIAVGRGDGRELEFRQPPSGTLYLRDADLKDQLERLNDGSGALIGWRYVAAEGDEVEEYDATGFLLKIRDRAGREQTMTYSAASTPPSVAPAAGLLIGVTDHFGRQLSFTYNAQKRIVSMTDPAGGQYLFEYDGPTGPAHANNLTKVTFPGTATRVYLYGEAGHVNGGSACSSPPPALLNALTGLTDENGSRYSTWTYDCQARATGSQHALGAEAYSFAYGNGFRDVLDPLNTPRTVTLQRVLGVAKASSTAQPAASGSGTVSKSAIFDANGSASSRTDFNGNRTNYTYDLARNLETSRTEGLTAGGGVTPQTRTITTEWHPTFRLPTAIAEPLRITTNVYDADGSQCGARGALCSRTIQATTDANGSQGLSATPSGTPRTWAYTYNANGSVLTSNGPRTDVSDTTTYTYYLNDDPELGKRANVATISNAAGHLTSITAYNAHGQRLTIIDANGMSTTLTYDERQRLKSRSAGGELTSYDYDAVGQLIKVTLPDGSYLDYDYDAAHRLTEISDNLGNRISYSLDAIGNRTLEQVFDPSSQLAQKRSRIYNALNRLFQELGAQNQTTEYAYDDQGNVTSLKDPLNHSTSNQYDALNRLKQVTDPGTGVTQYVYNGLDALTSVTDPRNLVTGYTVNGLGNLTQQASPDTGTTVNTYDAAGNLLTQTDAKSQTTTYIYDALNRVTLITFHDGSKQTYAYDQGANSIGRLSSITETNPSNQVTSQIAYAYELHGRVTSETAVNAVQHVVAYSYDSAGRLTGLTYPSGRTVTYAFDALGRVNQVSTTKEGHSQVVVQNVAYHPFGGVKSYTLGNGQVYSRSIDLDGRITSYTLGAQSFAIGYDAASRIEFISQFGNPANVNTYGYDSLDRLTSAVTPSTPYGYSYDAVGNRTSRTAGWSTHSYTYSSTSNRIASIATTPGERNFTFDANGSTTADGNNTYVYDVRGRMVQATSTLGATNYQINALGQRIRKSNSLGDTVFHYDTGGRLIAETDPGGALKRELIYLGDIPVGVVQ